MIINNTKLFLIFLLTKLTPINNNNRNKDLFLIIYKDEFFNEKSN